MGEEKDKLFEALLKGKRETKIKAAMHVTSLTPQQRNKLVDLGVINPLVSMVQSHHSESIQVALLALLSLSMRSQRNKLQIIQLNFLKPLIRILKNEKEVSFELGMAILLSLSTCNANKSMIVDSGVVCLLVNYLKNADDEQDVDFDIDTVQPKLDAVDTLHNLSTNRQAVFSMISDGCVFSLLQLVQKSDKVSKMVEKAMGLLEKIVIQSETGMEQISNVEGGILGLVETVEDGSQQSREHAVGVLYLMCKTSRDKYRELILKEGAIPGLLQLHVDGTWRAKELARSLLALLRESSSDYEARKRQLENGVLVQIMREIESTENKKDKNQKDKVNDTTALLVEKMRKMINVAA